MSNYKAVSSSFETAHDPDHLICLDDLECFHSIQPNITVYDAFQRINEIQYHLGLINDDEENLTELSRYLKELVEILSNEVYGNIDDFLENADIIETLFKLLDYREGRCVGTNDSIYILNILALIARNSPYSYNFVDSNINLLTNLLGSPDLLPRVVTIFLYSIDGAPQIIENLILNKGLISILAVKYFEIKDSEFVSPILTLISVLFDYISFDNLIIEITNQRAEEDEKESKNLNILFDNIVITFEGCEKRFYFEPKTQMIVTGIVTKLQSLINTLDRVEYKEVDPDNVFPILKILEKYLKCFATNEDNFYRIMRYVQKPIDIVFRYPFCFDKSGRIFRQVLAIYNQILTIHPRYFLPDQSSIVTADYFNDQANQLQSNLMIRYIYTLFDNIISFKKRHIDAVDLFFLLSNAVKFPQISLYILNNQLITKYNLFKLMNRLSYVEKENLLIALLTIMCLYPNEFYNEIQMNTFNDFIYILIEVVESTTVDYFIQIFLSSLERLLSGFQSLLKNVDKDTILDCLSSLATYDQINIAQSAQYLIERYFQDS